MAQPMTKRTLEAQNRVFAGTQGVSAANWKQGFIPGFLDRETGSIYVSRTVDGNPAPIHLIGGLPDDLVLARTSTGQVSAIKETVIAGFIRGGLFYTREQAAQCIE
jgi:hypothetical protein